LKQLFSISKASHLAALSIIVTLFAHISLCAAFFSLDSLLSLESLPSPVAFAFCPVCLRAARFAPRAALTLSHSTRLQRQQSQIADWIRQPG